MSNEILTEIKLELGKFREDLKAAQDQAAASGRASGQGFGDNLEAGLNKAFGGIKGQILALGASIAGAFTFSKAIEAAAQQEQSLQSLNAALAINGNYSKEASAQMEAFASALQKTTGVADDAVLKGAGLIANLSHLSGAPLQNATKAALDFSAALGIDTDTAFNIVAKATSGHASLLSRYGITLKNTGDQALDAANAIKALEQRFGGLAALQTNTFQGAMTAVKNQFGEVLESIGNVVIKSPTMIAMLKSIAGAFERTAAAISKWAEGRDIIQEVGLALAQVGSLIVNYVLPPLELVYNVGKIAFNGLALLIQGFIVGVATAAAKLAELAAPFSSLAANALPALQTFTESAKATFDDLSTNASESVDNIFNFDATAKAAEFNTNLQTFFEQTQPAVDNGLKKVNDAVKAAVDPSLFTNFTEGFKAAAMRIAGTAEAVATTMRNLGAQIFNTFGTGVSNAFSAMGAAMVKGENGMAAFGKAMLGVLGDIALQFGSTFILMGIAKSLLFDPTGPLLIAAGAALSILGGALKAIGGGGSSGPAAASPSGGGVAAGGGTLASPTVDQGQAFNDTQRNAVGTQIHVNVAGNVLDRRATGLELVDVLNESFSSNGLKVISDA